jgi:uroporphyrinogen-III synthase
MAPPQSKTVLLTHPVRANDPLKSHLETLGFTILHCPLISIQYNTATLPRSSTNHLIEPDWIFFTSRHGVNGFFGQMLPDRSVTEKPVSGDAKFRQSLGLQPEWLQQCNMAVVGEKTGLALLRWGCSATFTASVFDAISAANQFVTTCSPHGQRIWWPCGSLANPHFGMLLQKNGALVYPLPVYTTQPKTVFTPQELAQFSVSVDWVVFTSTSAVKAFSASPLWPTLKVQSACQFASIGPSTTQAVQEILHRTAIQPERYQFDVLAKAITDASF